MFPPDGSLPTLNDASPVAYRRQLDKGSLHIVCHATNPDDGCESYTLESTVLIPVDEAASRARALFSRLNDGEWGQLPDECDDHPDAEDVFRCEVPALPGDGGFAVQLIDTGFTPGGDQCAPDPDGTIPSCNEDGLYMGVFACQSLPTFDGDVMSCLSNLPQ